MSGAAEEGERWPFVVASEGFLGREDVEEGFEVLEVRAGGWLWFTRDFGLRLRALARLSESEESGSFSSEIGLGEVARLEAERVIGAK